MAVVSPRAVYDYLLANGVSPASAAGILANIAAESGFDSAVIGDVNVGGSGGLFQHHAARWDSLKAYAQSTGRHWTDWQAQVDFALREAKQMGLSLTHSDASKASYEWTVRFERPANAEAKAKQRAGTVAKYNYGGAASSSGSGSGAPVVPQSGSAIPAAASEELNVPTGGSWFRVGSEYIVAYRFYGNDQKTGPSQIVYYRASSPPPGQQIFSEAQYKEWSKSGLWTDGGTVDAFRGVKKGLSYQDLVNQTLLELGLAGTDALTDGGVMAIIALAMTREMSPEELANRLRQTKWYQARTDKQREWDDLSEAEKDARAVDEAMKLVGLWFTYVGEDLDVSAFDTDKDGVISGAELRAGNRDLFTWSMRVASGQITQAQAVNSWVKAVAGESADSPWSRTIRDEEKAQGQHGVDLSNMGGQIRDMYEEWGIPITDAKLEKLASDVVMNIMSIEDVEAELRKAAMGLYPTKPEGLSTRQWAEPYIQTYMGVLEVPEVGLTDALLQRGLRDGATLADFEKTLRYDDRWLGTNNARVEMNDKVSALGRQMGF
jgi:hypothetical protein